MGITVFRNGSLARERVRDSVGLDWKGFSDALRTTKPGNRGGIMLPWFESEITPPVLTPGVRTFGVDPSDGPASVRAVVEGQMLAMRRHSKWMGVTIDTIYATGGASANRDVLQVMADVFGAEVFQFEVGNSASLGAALRAYHADVVDRGEAISWDEVVEGFAQPKAESRVAPRAGARRNLRRAARDPRRRARLTRCEAQLIHCRSSSVSGSRSVIDLRCPRSDSGRGTNVPITRQAGGSGDAAR